MHDPDELLRIKITTPKLELVVADRLLLGQLGEVAARGVADPSLPSPFRSGWDRLSPPERSLHITARQIRRWAEFGEPERHYSFTICTDGQPIGEVTVRVSEANNQLIFATTSWIGIDHQRKGHGTEARLAALQFGFIALGADMASSMSFADNLPPQKISRELGYKMSGASVFPVPPCSMRRLTHYRLGRRIWESRHRRHDITITAPD
jgi:RimJ/RimL family protein N-acetyltransferase